MGIRGTLLVPNPPAERAGGAIPTGGRHAAGLVAPTPGGATPARGGAGALVKPLPEPAHPRDRGDVQWTGKGYLTDRLCPLPPPSVLPSGHSFLPVLDLDGNPWYLLVGHVEKGQSAPIVDVAAMLRFFTLGAYDPTNARDARERVDFAEPSQFPDFNSGSTVDVRARVIFDEVRTAIHRQLGFVATSDERGLSWELNGMVNRQGDVAESGERWRVRRTYGNASDRFLLPAEFDPPRYVEKRRLATKEERQAGADAVIVEKVWTPGSSEPVPPVGRWDRVAQINELPIALPPIPGIGFITPDGALGVGRWWAVGDAWSRVAVLHTYNGVSYPPRYFSSVPARMGELLDEQRIVEITRESMNTVNGLVQGILTYNFGPLVSGLTNAVQGPVLQQLRAFEQKLAQAGADLRRVGHSYGELLVYLGDAALGARTGATNPDPAPPGSGPVAADDDSARKLAMAGLAFLALRFVLGF